MKEELIHNRDYIETEIQKLREAPVRSDAETTRIARMITDAMRKCLITAHEASQLFLILPH